MKAKLTLRNHGKSTLHVLLEALIHERVATWHDEEQDLREGLRLVTSSHTSSNNCISKLLTSLAGVNDWISVLNSAAMTSVGLDEDIQEVANSLLISTAANNDNTP